jgi:hypothetical protein
MPNAARRLSFAFATSMVFLSACGGGEEDASNTDISNAAGGSSSACAASYPDTMGYAGLMSRNSGNVQCTSQVQSAEAYRQAAIANCLAGNTAAATTNYSYYRQSQSLVTFSCR